MELTSFLQTNKPEVVMLSQEDIRRIQHNKQKRAEASARYQRRKRTSKKGSFILDLEPYNPEEHD